MRYDEIKVGDTVHLLSPYPGVPFVLGMMAGCFMWVVVIYILSWWL